MSGGDSETIRFSVENLMYYAPQIASVGTTLAQAGATAQDRLLGLGDFCGHSWPDQAFATSYPPSQYALLIVVRQLAAQIQGIATGIQIMARNYGITEATLTANADRITAGERGTAALLAHTTMPPPPDNPASLPAFHTAPVIKPDPRAQQAPSPPPNSAPTPASSAHPTPDPEPQKPPTAHLNDPAAGHQSSWQHSGGLHLTGPWPSGNPDLMDEAAGYWNDLTLALEAAWSDLQRYTALIMSDSEGPAATAFSDYVDGLTGTGHGALTRAIDASQQMHDVCIKQAEGIRALKHSIEELLIQLLATFVIGQIISLLTFETTQALADALDGRILYYLTVIVRAFADDSEAISSTMEDAVGAVAKVASRGIAAGAQSAFVGTSSLAASNALDQAFGLNPTDGTAALRSILLSGGLGMFGGGFTASAGLLSSALISMGDSDSDSALAGVLLTLGRQLKAGSITVAAANVALQELIRQGRLTPEQFMIAVAGARLGTAVAPNTGSHAAP